MSAALILPRGPLTQQPQHAAPLDTSNPFVKNLVGAFVPGAGRTFEIVTGAQFGTFGTRPTLVAAPVGLGWQPGSYNLPLAMSPQFGPAKVTVIAIVKRVGGYGTYQRVLDVGGDSSSSGGWDIEATGGDGSGLQFVAWNNGTPSGGTGISLPLNAVSVLGFSNDGSTTRNYLNGAFLGAVGSTMTPATTSGRGPIGIGTDRGGGSAGSAGIIFGVFVFNRVLSDAEIRTISANPWQLFQAPRRRLWLAVNNTSGAALSGAAFAVASATGSLTTSIPLAASAAVVASASASLSTQIAFAGAAAGQAVATGSLSTQIRLAGSAGTATAASGALSTQIALAGAAAGAASASGALSTQIALAGTAAASSSATGALTAGTGLSGSASASASASGALTTSIRLAGAASCSSSASGDLSTTLAGAALSGAAAASSSASGSLATAIVLTGAAVAQASASGSLSGQAAALSGAAAASSSATGSLSTQILVAGAARAVASAVGSLSTQIRLAGAAACSSSATGSLSTGLLPPEPNPHRMIVVQRRKRHFVARRRVRHFEVGR